VEKRQRSQAEKRQTKCPIYFSPLPKPTEMLCQTFAIFHTEIQNEFTKKDRGDRGSEKYRISHQPASRIVTAQTPCYCKPIARHCEGAQQPKQSIIRWIASLLSQ
jgi:hypothetical protein